MLNSFIDAFDMAAKRPGSPKLPGPMKPATARPKRLRIVNHRIPVEFALQQNSDQNVEKQIAIFRITPRWMTWGGSNYLPFCGTEYTSNTMLRRLYLHFAKFCQRNREPGIQTADSMTMWALWFVVTVCFFALVIKLY